MRKIKLMYYYYEAVTEFYQHFPQLYLFLLKVFQISLTKLGFFPRAEFFLKFVIHLISLIII